MRMRQQTIWCFIPWLLVGTAAQDMPFVFTFNWGLLQEHTYAVTSQGIRTPTAILDPSLVGEQDVVTFSWNITGTNSTDWTFRDILLANITNALARGQRHDPGNPNRSSTLLSFNVSPTTSSGTISLDSDTINQLSQSANGDLLFFQLQWENSNDTSAEYEYGTTPNFGIASDSNAATSMYFAQSSSNVFLDISSVTTAAVAIQTMPSILGFDVSDSPSLPSSSSASSTDSPTAQSTGAVTTAESNNSKSGLSTGAIIGIAVGSAVFLILTALAAVFCRRHRRQQSNAKASRSDVQVMQDMLAEKTARSTVDVDTSYSEDARSHRPLYRGLGMSGVNHSSASMSLAGEGPVGRTTRSVSSIRRDSAAYTSLRNPPPIGTAVSIENGAGESPTTATHPESSTSGSPIGCSSTHQDRKFNPFPEAASSEHQEQHHYARGRTVSQKNSMSNLSNVLQVDHDLEPPSAVSGDILFEGHSIPGSAAGTPQLGPARFNVRSETPGGVSISEQYAHLVEDGMTEDEIRRLEEEERALDEAIEQHRAESRATTGG